MLKKSEDSNRSGGDDEQRRQKNSGWITLAFAIVILTPSMIGFVMKFSEFIRTFQGDSQGAFAITPMVNYLLASLGFLFLLLWAATNGAFRDMEAPKHTMLQRELSLDDDQRRSSTGTTAVP